MIFRNSEHYYDPTAGKAISNVMRENTEPMRENWEDLAIAVIAAQAEDYRALRKQLRETPRMREIDRLLIEVEILGIEMFFLSDWFCMLTDVDGGMILERLKKEEDANDGKGVSAAGLSA